MQFWFPCLRKDIAKLEGAQKEFTQSFHVLCGLPYHEQLNKVRYLLFGVYRDNMIETYKELKECNDAYAELFPLGEEAWTKGHNYNLRR